MYAVSPSGWRCLRHRGTNRRSILKHRRRHPQAHVHLPLPVLVAEGQSDVRRRLLLHVVRDITPNVGVWILAVDGLDNRDGVDQSNADDLQTPCKTASCRGATGSQQWRIQMAQPPPMISGALHV